MIRLEMNRDVAVWVLDWLYDPEARIQRISRPADETSAASIADVVESFTETPFRELFDAQQINDLHGFASLLRDSFSESQLCMLTSARW